MNPEKSLVETLEELRDDLKAFLETRFQIFRAEVTAAVQNSLSAAILLAVAAVLGLMGTLLISICIVIAIALGLGSMTNQVGLIWGFLIVGGCEVLIAGAMAGAGISKLKSADLKPRRTLHVLRHDQQALREGGQAYGDRERTRRRA